MPMKRRKRIEDRVKLKCLETDKVLNHFGQNAKAESILAQTGIEWGKIDSALAIFKKSGCFF